MKENNMTGLAISVIKDSNVFWTKSFGKTDRFSNSEISPNTIFEFGSLSKSITAVLVLRLAEKNIVSLDEPIGKYLKRWTPPNDSYWKEVTLRKILSHTAGISTPGWIGHFSFSKTPNLIQQIENEIYFVNEPGTKYSYSGGGFLLAGIALEDLTGKTFSTLVQEEIFVPLGMKLSSFENLKNPNTQIALGHMFWLPIKTPEMKFYFEKPAAGLHSSVLDFSLFVIELQKSYIGKSSFLSPNSMQLLFSPQYPEVVEQFVDSGDFHVGLGFYTQPTSAGLLIENGGTNLGFSSEMQFYPEKGLGVIVASNSLFSDREVSQIATYAIGRAHDPKEIYKFGNQKRKALLHDALNSGFIVILVSFITFFLFKALISIKKTFYKKNTHSRGYNSKTSAV